MADLTRIVAAAQQRAREVRPLVGGFPYLAEVLRQAGVVSVGCDVPSRTTTYLFADGAVIDQATPQVDSIAEVPVFDREALVAAIRADQAGQTDYPTFMTDIGNAGVVRYQVDLQRRTCTYQPAHGHNYVEHYPAVELPQAA